MFGLFQTIVANQCELATLVLMSIFFHAYRHTIGNYSLYLMLGIYFTFAVLTDSPYVVDGAIVRGLFLGMGNGLLWLPFLLVFVIIYQIEGTVASHRFMLGLLCSSAVFIFVLLILGAGLDMDAFKQLKKVFIGASPLSAGQFFSGVITGIGTHLSFMAVVPVVYQGLLNRRAPYAIALGGALAVYMVFNEAVFVIFSAILLGVRNYELLDSLNWGIRIVTIVWISILGHVYIGMNSQGRQKRRAAIDFIGQFKKYFLSSGHMLQSIEEWSERYQIVVENSEDLIFILNRDCRILNANRAASRCLGTLLDDKDFVLADAITDSDGNSWEWKEAFRLLVPVNDSDYYHSLPLQNMMLKVPGEEKPMDIDFNMTCALMNNEDVIVMIIHDMTLQREEARRKLAINEQMLHSQRLEALGQLAGGIAHDINNLIQSIQACIDNLTFKLGGHHEAKELLGNIDNACHRASNLTTQLLGFAHKGKYNAKIIDVRTLLDQAVQLVSPTAGCIKIKIIATPEPLLISGDENQLSQVLLNMLINSRDALDGILAPKISLRAETAREDMPAWTMRPDDYAFSTPEHYVSIRVKDNGCGIPKDVMPHIFDPFYTTKGIGKGTGMGLAMAFGCITHHHGWIHVNPDCNVGSEISIILPKYRPAGVEEKHRTHQVRNTKNLTRRFISIASLGLKK